MVEIKNVLMLSSDGENGISFHVCMWRPLPVCYFLCSLEGNLSMEERERKLKDEMRRTTFVQQLVVSAMLGEII